MLKLLLHTGAATLIHTYKWGELQLFRAISPWLETKGTEMLAGIGVVVHFDEEEKWTAEQETTALAKCQGKYQSLIHLQIKDKKQFFTRMANSGTLACGEMFMEGVWECQSEEDMIRWFMRNLENEFLDVYLHPVNRFLNYLELSVFNLQTKKRALEVAEKHYDLGNDLYESFLDPNMQYTCGYWATATDLNQAQLDKLELIAKKLDLKPGMRVLDMGCGFGTLCKYLAERYDVECVGVNISKEQVAYAREKCRGLKVDIRLQDYRDVNEQFDRLVSIGLLEHVGYLNYDEYFSVARRNLKDDGIFLVHTIGINHGNFPRSEPWLHTYIFPNGNLPFPNDLTRVTEGKFIIEDWHNFGQDYAKTLRAWLHNFKLNWPKLRNTYGDRFYKMWIYYLTACAASFSVRKGQLWQIVLTKDGIKREYRAAR